MGEYIRGKDLLVLFVGYTDIRTNNERVGFGFGVWWLVVGWGRCPRIPTSTVVGNGFCDLEVTPIDRSLGCFSGFTF